MIRAGLVGFGLAGRVFHAPLLASVEGFELVSVVERSTNLAAERYPGIKTCRSFEEMLADASLNLIVIATPNETHFPMAKTALEAGKNIVIDKPMSVHSAEIAELASLARARGLLAVPFHNRRWDGDFLTILKLIHEGSLGRLVHLESRMDRWNPGAARKPWKNEPWQGGFLADLATHLSDQALVLFGKPLGISAEVDRERDGEGANDSFTVRLRYDGLRVTLAANMLSSIPGSRYSLRGTKGSFRKPGIDPQEAALSKVTRIDNPRWGQEPIEEWGTLHVESDAGMDTEQVETLPGDYRHFYALLREAIEKHSAPPVTPADAWRVARILEWARQSAEERREIPCEWSAEPA
jgi:scyllo-inositol 2-dehydrogenase (NADP+)